MLESFKSFRNFLAKQVGMAEKMGVSDNSLSKATNRLADFLADNVEPRNKEEKILKELWAVASEEEQSTLAKLILRMIEDTEQKH
ncbi:MULTISPECIES: DUF3243 family protein [unclassified Candidatus Frackibacter]|uniref:DUF3243 family protein n=1 Tax=unclassified Candidatus Frackibacter TaxID=2648818 RepID=UPI000792ABE5|nr:MULTISPECIES: DUF3243 family protein [unclassified Candidatus Frackibacter]KXS44937.1 MAG: hypothetical protein AWU54_641 [Candidatus Frackibacter sp. T328-2]SDB97135.1 Protein of unknown function [Candidatus Frackibacter sp. WG11]SEM28789.1 Protein of unknown function [Candidatus Frackibacter sp. WG12]SFL33641.1 Protein of unknown function [Candidatus Frackibacter sp. WG13]